MGVILSRVKLKGKQVVLLIVFMLAASLAEMLLPTLLAQMIDKGIAESSHGIIYATAIVMAAMALIACITNIVATRISAKIATRFAADLRKEIFYQVQDFSGAEMDKFGTASLVTRSTSDVANVQAFLTMLLRMGVMAPLMAVAGLVLSSVTGGKVSSVLNVAIPLLIISSGIIIVFVSRYSIALRKMIDKINKLFLEALEGVRVIRAFNKQEHEINRFGDANTEYTKIAVTSSRVSGLLMPVIQVIFGVTTAAVMGMGAWYVSTGEIAVGAPVANAQYISMILASMIMLSIVIMMLPTAYACSKRIAEVLKTESSIRDGKNSSENRTTHSTVRFEDVNFVYPGADEPVLENISFETKPGEVTAIIGKTGCGKSSILKLIPRLYDPTSGHIYVNGMDIKKYAVKDLRDLIGYVPQKTLSFQATLPPILISVQSTPEKRSDEKQQRPPVLLSLSRSAKTNTMQRFHRAAQTYPAASASVSRLPVQL